LVAVLVSLACSVVVATAAVLLKPRQEINERLNMQRNILDVAGLMESGGDVAALFEGIETRLVEFASGAIVDQPDAITFDAVTAARDAQLGETIPAERDIAKLGRRAKFGKVYLARSNGRLDSIILPIRGSGLWSTLYGFIALAPDGNTVRAISFFEHAETPGLGDQIDDPRWRALWKGKQAFDSSGAVRLAVVKGRVAPDASSAMHQVDGLSGATLTGNGVTNLVRYWLGSDGYGVFLARLRAGEAEL
jgi:Na+-transporting NADH:ubiquinone oxidoreductase subunit C